MKKKLQKKNLFFIAFILFAHLVISFIYPKASIDGPWSLSHTFSMLNGDFFRSTFAHNFFKVYNLPVGFDIINCILYYPFNHTNSIIYSIFLVNAIVLFAAILLFKTIFNKTKTADFFLNNYLLLAIALSSSAYLERSELYECCLIAVFHLLLLKIKEKYSFTLYFLAFLLLGFITYVHSVGGCYTAIFFTLYAIENKWKFINWLKFSILSACTFILLMLPSILPDVNAWITNYFLFFYSDQQRPVKFIIFINFFIYAAPLIPVIIFLYLKILPKKIILELIYFASVVLILLVFGRYYYFFYLFHFFAWRLSVNPDLITEKWQQTILILCAAAGTFFTIGFSFYQLYESRETTEVFKKGMMLERLTAQQHPENNIWVSPFMSMSVIDQKNARLHYAEYEQTRIKMPPFTTNDILFIEEKQMFSYIKTYKTNASDSFVLTNIIPPVKGLKQFRLRSVNEDSIGLWKVSIVKKSAVN